MRRFQQATERDESIQMIDSLTIGRRRQIKLDRNGNGGTCTRTL